MVGISSSVFYARLLNRLRYKLDNFVCPNNFWNISERSGLQSGRRVIYHGGGAYKVSAKLQHIEFLQYQLRKKKQRDDTLRLSELDAAVGRGDRVYDRLANLKLRLYLVRRGMGRSTVRLGVMSEEILNAKWRSDWLQWSDSRLAFRGVKVPEFIRRQYRNRRRNQIAAVRRSEVNFKLTDCDRWGWLTTNRWGLRLAGGLPFKYALCLRNTGSRLCWLDRSGVKLALPTTITKPIGLLRSGWFVGWGECFRRRRLRVVRVLLPRKGLLKGGLKIIKLRYLRRGRGRVLAKKFFMSCGRSSSSLGFRRVLLGRSGGIAGLQSERAYPLSLGDSVLSFMSCRSRTVVNNAFSLRRRSVAGLGIRGLKFLHRVILLKKQQGREEADGRYVVPSFFRNLLFHLLGVAGRNTLVALADGQQIQNSYRQVLNVQRVVFCLQWLARVLPGGFSSISNKLLTVKQWRSLPYRLYITGRKQGVIYSLVDGFGRSVFTFSGGMLNKSYGGGGRRGRASSNFRNKRIFVVKSKLRVRRLRTLGGRKPRDKKKFGGRGSKKSRSFTKLYYSRFKHHLRPLALFLVSRWGIVEMTKTVRQLVIVVRGQSFYRKVGERLVLGLLRVLRQVGRRVLSVRLQGEYKKSR